MKARLKENSPVGNCLSLLMVVAMVAVVGCARPQLEVVEEGAAVVVRGARAELRVEDGRITSLKGPDGMSATGTIREQCGRLGLGVMIGAYNTSYVHSMIASPLVMKDREDERQKSFRAPEARSVRQVIRNERGVTIKWRGLSDGQTFFPDNEFEVEFGTDDRGAITMQTRGKCPKGGVFGVLMPIENLADRGAFVLPFLGGLRFNIADMKKGVWQLYCDFLYCQAPVAAIETPRGSFGIWSEDDQFNQYLAYFPKGDKTAAFGWEWLTLCPFELQTQAKSPVMKIDAFPEGDWLGAATPYRNWFQNRFQEEIATRERNEDPNVAVRIATSWDKGKFFDDHLDTLTNLFGKSIVFMYGKMTTESTLPPHRYDWGLPGHTPDLSYVEQVKARQKRGIKCSCYSNAYCANYDSPAFKRDQVNEFALPTLNCAYQYRAMSKEAVAAAKVEFGVDQAQALQTMNNTLRNVDTDVKPWDTPADKWRKMKFKDQELVYLDMNSKKWREYIVGVHKRLFDALGLQAFYSDCLGVIRDTGNGVVDGTSGAMGSHLLAKELQAAIPMAFSAECGTAPIAMCISYAHQSAGFMRNKPKLMDHRFWHSVPLCAYLFGYRVLCGGYEVYRPIDYNFTACACDDALGGMGSVSHPPWNTRSGIHDHLVVRSLTFAHKGLKPYFPTGVRMPKGVTSMYRDRDGGIYRYCGEGAVQVMYAPDGQPLWGRVHGASEFDVPGLELPGWPKRKGSRHYGLKETGYYALFPVRGESVDYSKVYGNIGETEKIIAAYDTSDFTYLELEGKTPQITFKTKESKPEYSRHISSDSGIEVFGTEHLLAKAPRCQPKPGIEMVRVEDPANFRTIDFVHTVKPGEAVRFITQNREFGSWSSDGCLVGVYINGQRQIEYDTGPSKNPKWVYQHAKRYIYDYRMHRMTVPLDRWVGQTVLVSVRLDAKGGTYDDRQEVALPEIVKYAGEPLDEIVKGMVPETAYQHFNGAEVPRE